MALGGGQDPDETYVHRTELESELDDFMNSATQSCLIVGDSGSGKTWLIKHILKKRSTRYEVISASYDHEQDFEELARQLVAQKGLSKKDSETRGWGVNLLSSFFGATRESAQTVKFEDGKNLDMIYDSLKAKELGGAGAIIFDNLELALSSERCLPDVVNIIMKVPSQGELLPKSIFVSADRAILARIHSLPNYEPVLRRIRIIDKVNRFTTDEARQLMIRILGEPLFEQFEEKAENFVQSVAVATDLRPAYVAGFASLLKRYGSSDISGPKLFKKVQTEWWNQSFKSYTDKIVRHMNSRHTDTGKRDCVMYAIARIDDVEDFPSILVRDRCRELFPKINFTQQEVTSSLNKLAADSDDGSVKSILQKSDKSAVVTYRFRGSGDKLALRFGLALKSNNQVVFQFGQQSQGNLF
ncbi:MAG: AAA family ATPase [Hyphomonas sp.]|nr:AAA family ATPase [Hyphomonas sp.]